MEFRTGSLFQWRFTGFTTENDAKKSLEDMERWFQRTFDSNEWQVSTSLFQNTSGFGAEMNARKEI